MFVAVAVARIEMNGKWMVEEEGKFVCSELLGGIWGKMFEFCGWVGVLAH